MINKLKLSNSVKIYKYSFLFFWKKAAKRRNMDEGTIFGHLADALKAKYTVAYKRGLGYI